MLYNPRNTAEKDADADLKTDGVIGVRKGKE
jgi:hypothetical protein